MKIETLQELKDLFQYSYEMWEPSKVEHKTVRDYYHGRHYDNLQLHELALRKQPAEYYNLIKLYARLLTGYFDKVANTVMIEPRQDSDRLVAGLLHDVVNQVFEDNQFGTVGNDVKLDAMLAGIMAVYLDVEDTGERDDYGRPINRIDMSHVPVQELVLDPMSTQQDFSDSRFMHRFKWVSEDYMRDFIMSEGKSKEEADSIIEELNAYENTPNQVDTDFDIMYRNKFVQYKSTDCFLIVHTIATDDNKDTYSIFWSCHTELRRTKITHKKMKFPYRVFKITKSDILEHYGTFREALPIQDAVNQALIKIQTLANGRTVLFKKGAVDSADKFIRELSTLNPAIEVKSIADIHFEPNQVEVKQQYEIIDNAKERIEALFGITPSFLGNADASSSGRKVKLQQNATVNSLVYLEAPFQEFYRLLGIAVADLVKEYYTAEQAIRIANEPVGSRWAYLNQPIMTPKINLQTGQPEINPETGEPVLEPIMEEVIDPDTGESMVDDEGRYIVAPLPRRETEIAFTPVDIVVRSTPYNDNAERTQLMIEGILGGNAGQFAQNTNPAVFARIQALQIRGTNTKDSHLIADWFDKIADELEGKSIEEAQYQSQGGAGGGAKQQASQPARSAGIGVPSNSNGEPG